MTKSIGKLLMSQREKKKLTLEDIYKFIKIHPKYLYALENDDYSVFKGKVHAKGFLKVYSEFLDLNLDEVLALWRREYEGGFNAIDNERKVKLKNLDNYSFVLTTKIVLTALGIIFCILFFGYLFYQYKNYTDAPKLDIYYPQNNLLLEQDILDVTGKTDIDSEVFINNQKIILNPDGSFATSIKLKEGINSLKITAVNKLLKKTEIIRTVIYRPGKVNIEKTEETSESTESTPPEETQPIIKDIQQ